MRHLMLLVLFAICGCGGQPSVPVETGFAEFGKFAAYLQNAKEERPLAACSTLIDISDALKRRGGGFQVGGLMDASTHERIKSFLIRHLRKEAPRPDLIAPTVEEVLECDKAIFVALQKRCDRDDAGLTSLSLQVDKVLGDPEIIAMVGFKMGYAPRGQQPKREAPANAQGAPPAARAKATPGEKTAKNKAQRDRKKARIAEEKAELARLRQHVPGTQPGPPAAPHPGNAQGAGAGKGGKGRGKGKGKGTK